MTESAFWGFVLRLVQASASAAVFILVGFLIAAVFRTLMGEDATRRLFGLSSSSEQSSRSSWSVLLRAWLIGMLLPVCSLGAIPVARELKRIGLPAGTVFAFAMTAPLFNPLSLLYGLTLSEPTAILGFAGCSLLIVTVLGASFDRLFPVPTTEHAKDAPVPPGWRRIAATAVSMLRDIASASSLYVFIGLVGVAGLGALLPTGAMQVSLEADDPLAIPRMVALAVPVYATPMLAMSQLGMMFSHVNSIGAAFVLLVLGAGMNLGLLAWIVKQFGLARAGAWFAMLIFVVAGLAYTVDKPLTPKGVEPAGHTHAFDIYCRPFRAGDVTEPAAFVAKTLGRMVMPYERQSAYIFIGLAVAAAVLAVADGRGRLEASLTRTPAGDGVGRGDIVIPGPILGLSVLGVLVVLSVVGCFTYYPPKDEVFAEMFIARGEALSGAISGDVEHATYWISELDDWSRKLEVGTYLRTGSVSDFQRIKGRLLRDKLEFLEHEVEDLDDPTPMDSPVRELTTDVYYTYTRLKAAYQ